MAAPSVYVKRLSSSSRGTFGFGLLDGVGIRVPPRAMTHAIGLALVATRSLVWQAWGIAKGKAVRFPILFLLWWSSQHDLFASTSVKVRSWNTVYVPIA